MKTSDEKGEGRTLWLSQMADDGLHLGLQEGAALRVVIQGTELLHKQRTALYPAVEGLHCSIGGAARLVKQSQLGLAIRTDGKHFEL